MTVRDLFKRWSLTPEETRADNLCRWVETLAPVGVTAIEEVLPRHRVKVAGVIQNIRIDPSEGGGSIEATIIDGTGEIVAKWLGRSAMPGIRLGMGLIVEGTPGVGSDGYLVVLNPEFSLVPGPEHG